MFGKIIGISHGKVAIPYLFKLLLKALTFAERLLLYHK